MCVDSYAGSAIVASEKKTTRGGGGGAIRNPKKSRYRLL